MNNLSEGTKETPGAKEQRTETGFFANHLEKLKRKDFTCPFCREVVKGISAFGRHLKDHCT